MSDTYKIKYSWGGPNGQHWIDSKFNETLSSFPIRGVSPHAASVFSKRAVHAHFLADLQSFLHNKGRAACLTGSDHRAYQKLAKVVFKLKLAKMVFELTHLQSDQ